MSTLGTSLPAPPQALEGIQCMTLKCARSIDRPPVTNGSSTGVRIATGDWSSPKTTHRKAHRPTRSLELSSIAALSVPVASVRPMGNPPRQIRAGAMATDDRELQAQLILTLNQLQATNERCRGLLLDGNLSGLVTMGRKTSDLAVTLMLLASRGQDPDVVRPFTSRKERRLEYDQRERAAGEHLEP